MMGIPGAARYAGSLLLHITNGWPCFRVKYVLHEYIIYIAALPMSVP